ncbi:hypothetical protein JZ751_027317 [Albula glossodonta]|uniref:Uncharacterized protein n=1 Tax=Albula glossodonta TaxID=121402 RepID=A0A8T2NFA1_9TELE|nr:hypothetical protein JZ751_027317 [Albula glossodonta]
MAAAMRAAARAWAAAVLSGKGPHGVIHCCLYELSLVLTLILTLSFRFLLIRRALHMRGCVHGVSVKPLLEIPLFCHYQRGVYNSDLQAGYRTSGRRGNYNM